MRRSKCWRVDGLPQVKSRRYSSPDERTSQKADQKFLRKNPAADSNRSSFCSFPHWFGFSMMLNFGAILESPIRQSSISIKKRSTDWSKWEFSHSMAFACSSRARFTIHIMQPASFPAAYVMIWPRCLWLDSSSWFSMMTVFPYSCSLAKISARKSPTLSSVPILSRSRPTASPRRLRFSSWESHFVKSAVSFFQMVRRLSIFSSFPRRSE